MENTLLKIRNEATVNKLDNHSISIIPAEDEDMHDHGHFSYSTETPLRQDAFELTENEKIAGITHHFKQILNILGMNLNDESLKETPHRVAKMYVKEVFRGLNPVYKPEVKLFPNKYQYHQMLVEKDITIYSYCEHHLVPIIGKAHIAYIPEDYVAGLSKLNRIARYYAQRPQVQERLTIQIGKELVNSLKTRNVAVLIEADHLCVASRGVKDVNSSTITSFYSGSFQDESVKNEFLRYVG